MESLTGAIQALPPMEAVAVLLAIAYLVLVIRQNILCWAAAFTSALLYLVIFARAQLFMEAALQIFYAAMAVYGWYRWRTGSTTGLGLPIRTWPPRQHAVVLVGILILTLGFGLALRLTPAALPFADSFTTVAALVATYMVAQKILENWWYWFVIDSVSVYLYVSRGLWLTALLFVLYLVLIIVGYRRWLRAYRAQATALAA
jgi:nicotinamide mononucleotide transporter